MWWAATTIASRIQTNLDRTRRHPIQPDPYVAVSGVLRRTCPATASAAIWLNNNQVGVILQANSGLPFNIRSNGELNKDGLNNDRPLFVERNSGRLGKGRLPRPSLLAVHPDREVVARRALR